MKISAFDIEAIVDHDMNSDQKEMLRMGVMFINPGSGPVENSSWTNAQKNIRAFIEDLNLPEISVSQNYTSDASGNGRFMFVLDQGEHSCEIEMPGKPLNEVRYVDGPDQNISKFPRLYVDGDSWLWQWAVDRARDHLLNGIDYGH